MDYIELEKVRKKALLKVLWIYFLCFVTLILGVFFLVRWATNDEGMACLVGFVTLLAWVAISTTGDVASSDFEVMVKENLLPSVLKNITQGCGKIKWSRGTKYYAGENKYATHVLFGDDNCQPQEMFKGTYHNVKFELEEYLEERSSGKSRYTLIRGNIIRIPLSVDYFGKVVLWKKKFFTSQRWECEIFTKTQKMQLGPVFGQNRSVFTDNPTVLDKIFTTDFIDFVSSLPEKYCVAFIDSNLYIIYSTSRDTFKMGSVWKKVDDPKQYARFESDLMEALNIVEKAGSLVQR